MYIFFYMDRKNFVFFPLDLMYSFKNDNNISQSLLLLLIIILNENMSCKLLLVFMGSARAPRT